MANGVWLPIERITGGGFRVTVRGKIDGEEGQGRNVLTKVQLVVLILLDGWARCGRLRRCEDARCGRPGFSRLKAGAEDVL